MVDYALICPHLFLRDSTQLGFLFTKLNPRPTNSRGTLTKRQHKKPEVIDSHAVRRMKIHSRALRFSANIDYPENVVMTKLEVRSVPSRLLSSNPVLFSLLILFRHLGIPY